MEIRRDITIGIGALIVAGVMVAALSIGLFWRMKPALEHILEDNIVTLDAVREILLVFTARGGQALESADRARIEAAIGSMRDNLTVTDEADMVARITDAVGVALSGDHEGLTSLAVALDRIARANNEAMAEADHEAQRLGEAGAWTAAFGGLVLVLLGIYTRRRLERRIVRPLHELSRVLEASRAGDERARCKGLRGAVELERALKQTNRLIDRVAAAGETRHDPRLVDQASALTWLLAERDGAWAVISADHGLVAANDAAHERLSHEDGPSLLSAMIKAVSRGQGDGLTVIEQGHLGLYRLPDQGGVASS